MRPAPTQWSVLAWGLPWMLTLALLAAPWSAWGQQVFIPPEVKVAGKPVLICETATLPACLQRLPESTRAQLPEDISSRLGYRSAMVFPLSSAEVAGLILWAPWREQFSQSALVGSQLLELELSQQLMLTFWHEVGHLEVRALQGKVLPERLSLREQEWLADAYLYWHLAKEQGSLQLAWQQFHRRNLQVMNDVSHLSHWSSLYLLPLLNSYKVEDLVLFTGFGEFCQSFYPRLRRWSDAELTEFSHLLQYLFGSATLPVLPDYLYWRKPELAPVLEPTLNQLMGPSMASDWLAKQHLLIKG